MKERYFENEYVEIWFENGVIHEIFKPKTVLTLEVAKIIVRDRIQVSGGKITPMFVDLRNMVASDNAARSYTAKREAYQFLSAGAFLISHQVHKLLMNLWLKLDRPKIPVRAFTDKDKAMEWLEQYKYLS